MTTKPSLVKVDESKLVEGYKADEGKAPWHLAPWDAFSAIVKVLAFGAKKYTDRNWEKGMDWSRMYDSAMRHLLAFWNGEDIDKESGLPHIDHALWNVAGLAHYAAFYRDRDDRPRKDCEIEEIIKAAEEETKK